MTVPTLSPAPPTLPPFLKSARADLSTTRSKKRKVSALFDNSSGRMAEREPEARVPAIPVAATENVGRDVGPFLSKHIPQQYAPQGPSGQEQSQLDGDEKGNTKYCYRHRPDIKCRRQADELTMEQLQKVFFFFFFTGFNGKLGGRGIYKRSRKFWLTGHGWRISREWKCYRPQISRQSRMFGRSSRLLRRPIGS